MEGVSVDAANPAAFGELLRRHRLGARLTQAALAGRAGVSVRAFQYLKRSAGQPQRETTRRLAEALGLTSEDRARFERAGAPAARSRAAPDPADRHRARTRDARDDRDGAILGPPTRLIGEHKRVTVLVADVAGLTDSVRGFEPDLADRVLAGIVPHLVDVVHRYEGTVNRAGGNGIMALFGAPVAHEDDAVRACYAALAMHEAFGRHARRIPAGPGINMALRIGLDSGEVVIRTASNDLYREYAALGPSVRLASRLGQLAAPGATLL